MYPKICSRFTKSPGKSEALPDNDGRIPPKTDRAAFRCATLGLVAAVFRTALSPYYDRERQEREVSIWLHGRHSPRSAKKSYWMNDSKTRRKTLSKLFPENEFRDAAMRIVVQRNDFLLLNLLDMLVRHRSLEIAPHYQRRTRWDNGRKSRLIESFLVNIPVPPVFLYENDFARYEVMDGQQRVAAIQDYFDNQFALTGLEILKSLQGKRYHELPSEVQSGLQRRSLSAIILLKESAPSAESESLLREHVFRRLNTGGVRLNAQEIRNAVFAGPFNDLLVELSRHPLFTEMWGIPPVLSGESAEPSVGLRRNSLYRTMRDVEYVLRVFALLDPANIAGGMKGTLDNAMKRYGENNLSAILKLGSQFLSALELAHAIGGKDAFRVPSHGSKRGRLSGISF